MNGTTAHLDVKFGNDQRDGVRCPTPGCNKKLLESLNGTAIVFCRHCKQTVTLTGDDMTYADFAKSLAAVLKRTFPVTTKKLDNGMFEHTF